MSSTEKEVLKQLKTFQKYLGKYKAYYVLKSYYAEIIADCVLQGNLEIANKYLNHYKLAKTLLEGQKWY